MAVSKLAADFARSVAENRGGTKTVSDLLAEVAAGRYRGPWKEGVPGRFPRTSSRIVQTGSHADLSLRAEIAPCSQGLAVSFPRP